VRWALSLITFTKLLPQPEGLINGIPLTGPVRLGGRVAENRRQNANAVSHAEAVLVSMTGVDSSFAAS